ncbi:ROK family protein [Nonomuraea phyllanthi]|uniref:ROK family protein n=1 Tax=Nonomuraea phyllanthi TaxID=2219224 RepID=UPI001293595D|nr:ROK family protein [Nonomuraea phyllanthi]QFY12780.1 ROK family protein [Nonomuraea phyllanthi]
MILAIDVGGTKLAAGLVAHDGTVTRSVRVGTPQGADAETLWRTLVDLVSPLSAGAEGVGVGCGGPMSRPGGDVSPLNIPGWRGFPLRTRLAALFPGVPVRLHNDAVCLAVAEHWKGAGRRASDMLGMVVSTGVGGGLILNGRLVNGRTGNAGHIGHVVVEPVGGPRCGCGGHGCLEAVASGPALTAWALAHGWTPRSGGVRSAAEAVDGGVQAARDGLEPVRAAVPEAAPARASVGGAGSGASVGGGGSRGASARAGEPGAVTAMAGGSGAVTRPGGERGDPAALAGARVAGAGETYREDRAVTARVLAADARAGEPVALTAMCRAGRALGIAIASATHLCDLDLVTIGGGLAQAGEPLFGPLEEALREHARMRFARRVEVVPAALGQDAGLVGAAALMLAGERYWG